MVQSLMNHQVQSGPLEYGGGGRGYPTSTQSWAIMIKIDKRFTWLTSQLPFQHKSSQVTVHVSFWSSSLNEIPFSVSPHTF
jgi:hypothetical protein